jgi:hypothetical protein
MVKIGFTPKVQVIGIGTYILRDLQNSGLNPTKIECKYSTNGISCDISCIGSLTQEAFSYLQKNKGEKISWPYQWKEQIEIFLKEFGIDPDSD